MCVDDESGGLVTVIVTRRVDDGLLLPVIVLVDRTCLGVKSAHALLPDAEPDFSARIEALSERLGRLRPCDALFAQSVVFHAVDYAKTLGFDPSADFDAALVGPRPPALLDVPHARPAAPIYVAGPGDDWRRVCADLDASVGAGNYLFVHPLDPTRSAAEPAPRVDFAHQPVDWARATSERETRNLLAGLELHTARDLERALDVFEQALASGQYRDWEAVIRDEQFLEIPPEHEAVFDADADLEFDGYEIRTIRGEACPCAVWHETARSLARAIVGGCTSASLEPETSVALATRLERAVAEHARELLLPPECVAPLDVLPEELTSLTRSESAALESGPRATEHTRVRSAG